MSDRYDALSVPRHPQRMACVGPCEATGWVPAYHSDGDTTKGDPMALVIEDETDEALIALWREAERVNPDGSGWHAVRCPDCDGTGLAGSPGVAR